ncbi:formylglycine-generating enzyme family protein [Nostoc sp. UHCC 0870]|uniref:formylglycine-generating enzyme family protein n=1 Tax=Nostoc sp. UHCC 0870 TaxID=2914041 RepID=UPI002ECFF9D5
MSAPSEKEPPKSQETEIDLTAQELADIIWLMVQINPLIDTAEVAPVTTPDNSQTTSSPTLNSQPGNVSEQVETVTNTAPAYVDTPPHQAAASEPTSTGLPIKITDPLALRNTLALGRSLRPFMRQVPSLTETVLNEEATVTSIAEEDFWLPVVQPVLTRWLEVALVIEETPRLPLWRQILIEFQQLLERHGAFRHVTLWYLKMGDAGEIELYLQHRQASFKELNDPSGRRLIWLVSDCVSPIWHNGSLLKILRNWAKIQPVSLLQLLPERLWSRTALAWGMEVQLYSQTPGVPNTRLLKTRQPPDKKFNSPQALTLPIVTLEAFPMKNWAKVLAGVGGSRTPGLVFLPEEIENINSQVSQNAKEDNKLSAEARVSRFQAAAYPLSRQLARMMAAAPVSLPVIRLIQQTLLPDSSAVHLAEVFMGGLLQPILDPSPNLSPTNVADFSRDLENPSPNLSPTRREALTFPPSLLGKGVGGLGLKLKQEVKYEFYPGVREELIKITRKSQTINVILCLSEFINRELQLKQSKRNFDAILFDTDVQIDSDYLPFAQITAQTLQLLGGKYAEMSQRIEQKITQSYIGISNLQTQQFTTVTVNRRGEIIKSETKTAQYFSENLGNNITLEMVAIPGGKFMMGSPPEEAQRYDSESPQHEVIVPPFFMGKYPITQAQWRAVATLEQVNRKLQPDPSQFKGDDLPVEQISWYEAVEFCDRLLKHTQKNYRLPSEAEWEYACRAGTTTAFHFGETISPDLGNYYYDGVPYGDALKGKSVEQTTPVGRFKLTNAFGLYGMHGNVYECCADHWHENYEAAPTNGSAWISIDNENDNQSRRLLRGGSWLSLPRYCRSASREYYGPGSRDINIGFRVAIYAART